MFVDVVENIVEVVFEFEKQGTLNVWVCEFFDWEHSGVIQVDEEVE